MPSDNNYSGAPWFFGKSPPRTSRATTRHLSPCHVVHWATLCAPTYIRNCGEREAVCATLIPLILRRHACCSCLSEMRHRRRRSSRNKKALRGCACMHRVCMHSVAPIHTRPPEQTLCTRRARFVTGCLERCRRIFFSSVRFSRGCFFFFFFIFAYSVKAKKKNYVIIGVRNGASRKICRCVFVREDINFFLRDRFAMKLNFCG